MCVLPVHMFSPIWQQKNTFCLRFSIKLSNLASQFALCSAKDLASQREAPSFRQAKFIDSNDIEHKICQINKYKMKTSGKQHFANANGIKIGLIDFIIVDTFRLNTIEPFCHHSISRTHRKCERKQKLPFENNCQKKRAECVHKPTQKRAFHLCRYGSILHSSCRCKLLSPPNVLCKEKKSSKQLNKTDDGNQSEQKNYTTKWKIVVVVLKKNAPTFPHKVDTRAITLPLLPLRNERIQRATTFINIRSVVGVFFRLLWCGAIVVVDFGAIELDFSLGIHVV